MALLAVDVYRNLRFLLFILLKLILTAIELNLLGWGHCEDTRTILFCCHSTPIHLI